MFQYSDAPCGTDTRAQTAGDTDILIYMRFPFHSFTPLSIFSISAFGAIFPAEATCSLIITAGRDSMPYSMIFSKSVIYSTCVLSPSDCTAAFAFSYCLRHDAQPLPSTLIVLMWAVGCPAAISCAVPLSIASVQPQLREQAGSVFGDSFFLK